VTLTDDVDLAVRIIVETAGGAPPPIDPIEPAPPES
jgi:hypothetical protein